MQNIIHDYCWYAHTWGMLGKCKNYKIKDTGPNEYLGFAFQVVENVRFLVNTDNQASIFLSKNALEFHFQGQR